MSTKNAALDSGMYDNGHLLVRVPNKVYEEHLEPLLQLISRYLVFVKPPRLIKIVSGDQGLALEGKLLSSLIECSSRLKAEMEKAYPKLLHRDVPMFLSFLRDFELLKGIEVVPSGAKTLETDRGYSLGHLTVGLTENLYLTSYKNFLMKLLVIEVSYVLRHALRPDLLSKGKANEFIEYRSDIARKLMTRVKLNLPPEDLDLVSLHSTFKSMGLSKFFPPLADAKVDELYIDGPGEYMYIDHSENGRLDTNIKVRTKDIEALVTLMRRESGLRLDFSSPSIKANLNSKVCLARVSIDTQPLTLSPYVVDIRKLRATPYNVLDLLCRGAISQDAACLLLLCLYHRSNITIVGEPGSGKTTLLNALDLCTPRTWRKIYIEDTPEVQKIHWQHQTRFLVDPYGTSVKSRGTKTSEIIKTLHRNPSYVVLGEVQSAEQIRALFHACASGIRVIHTVHSRDLEHFLGRLLHVYDIRAELLKYLDILVECFKLETSRGTLRVVRRVSEIEFEGGYPRLRDLVVFDTRSGWRSQLLDAGQASIFRKMAYYNMIGVDDISLRFLELRNVFSNLDPRTRLSWKTLQASLSYLYTKWSFRGREIYEPTVY